MQIYWKRAIKKVHQCIQHGLKETKWIKLLDTTLKLSINTIWQRGRDYSCSSIKGPINLFWKDVFASWLQIDEQTPLNETLFFHEHIWHNPKLTIDNK